MDIAQVRTDLIAEQAALDAVVDGLTEAEWAVATPSPGWSVADQIGHLAYFDRAAATAITDTDAFSAMVADLATAAAAGLTAADDFALRSYRALPSQGLLEHWRGDRAVLADAALRLDNDTRVIWYGPSMGAKSFLTARLMETWAHGRDILDAVGATQPATDRLRHVVQLGVITREWSYRNRGFEPPDAAIAIELTSPSGAPWRFGPDHAEERLTGTAEHFCLVVTQRRHVDDTSLDATPLARDWMLKAQAFAGPPTDGPAPGTRP